MNNPLVSIVIPCYNYGRFLKDAIESALSQTYQNIEIIICDDASTDETSNVVTRYNKNSNVKYVQQPTNIGQSENRNVGINLANGKYIMFLDADDTYEPKTTEKQVHALENNPQYEVAYCRSNHCDENLNKIITPHDTRPCPSGWVYELLFKGCFILGMTIMVRSDLLKQIGGFPNKDETLGVGVDWRVLLELSTKTQFYGIDSYEYNYRQHGTQMSLDIDRRIESDNIIRQMFFEKYPNLTSPKLYKQAKVFAYLQKGAYYRKNGRCFDSIKNYLQYAINNPFELVGYKGAVKTLISSRGTGGH